MQPLLVWTLVALAVAVLVGLVAAGATGGDRAPGEPRVGPWTALRRRRSRDAHDGVLEAHEGVLAGARRELVEAAEVEPSSVDDIFAVGRPTDSGYVRADELARGLTRAGHTVRRGALARRRRDLAPR